MCQNVDAFQSFRLNYPLKIWKVIYIHYILINLESDYQLIKKILFKKPLCLSNTSIVVYGLYRERHQFPVEDGVGQGGVPPLWLFDRSVALERLPGGHQRLQLQPALVGPQVQLPVHTTTNTVVIAFTHRRCYWHHIKWYTTSNIVVYSRINDSACCISRTVHGLNFLIYLL